MFYFAPTRYLLQCFNPINFKFKIALNFFLQFPFFVFFLLFVGISQFEKTGLYFFLLFKTSRSKKLFLQIFSFFFFQTFFSIDFLFDFCLTSFTNPTHISSELNSLNNKIMIFYFILLKFIIIFRHTTTNFPPSKSKTSNSKKCVFLIDL
jgi:hypothetical protein